jgi:hypothetical protein
VPDGHPARDGVGVDHDVGGDARLGEGHVLLGGDETDDPLLPVTGGELVPRLGDPLVPGPDLDEPGAVLPLGDDDRVDDPPARWTAW